MAIFRSRLCDQLPITFVWHDLESFKSYQSAQLLQGNKKEPNNHHAMWSWGSGGQKNIKKSSRKWDFLPGFARSIPYNFCLMWPQTFSMFLICQTTLGEQKRTKQPWSYVFMGVRGPKKHQKKPPEMGFFQISTTGSPIYIYIYIYINIYI